MKIGQFARKYEVSIDTIRYYMELMLIIPEKVGGQYEFGEGCMRDLEEILWLKTANFSLNEIQRVFTLKRLTSLKNDEDISYYKELFNNKKNELINRRNEIDEIIEKIEMKIKDTQNKINDVQMKLGLPIELLHLLACPKCKRDFILNRASVENNHIINGELKCNCGYEANIKDGIVILQNNYVKPYDDEVDLEGHFVEQTSSEFVNLLYKSSQWMVNKLDIKNQKGKVILEPGTGSGMFLSSIFKDIPQDCVYISVDHDIELMRKVKEKVQNHYIDGSFIFISSDFLEIPIKDNSIDVVIDHFGTTNYAFKGEGYLINLIDYKVKKGGKWIGDYLNFKPGAKSLLQYPEKNRKYFYLKNIIESFEKSKFKAIEMMDMGYTEKGGIYERFFIEGDRLYDFVYYGEKID